MITETSAAAVSIYFYSFIYLFDPLFIYLFDHSFIYLFIMKFVHNILWYRWSQLGPLVFSFFVTNSSWWNVFGTFPCKWQCHTCAESELVRHPSTHRKYLILYNQWPVLAAHSAKDRRADVESSSRECVTLLAPLVDVSDLPGRCALRSASTIVVWSFRHSNYLQLAVEPSSRSLLLGHGTIYQRT